MSYSLKALTKLINDIEKSQRKEKQKHKYQQIGYSPKCKVCTNSKLDEIEEARENGFTYKEIVTELDLDISIMSLSRHFTNHYPQSKKFKQKKKLETLNNIKEAYIKYPFLEEFFKNKEYEYLECFNNHTGFCTDKFSLCDIVPPNTVSNSNNNINRLYIAKDKAVENKQKYSFYRTEEAVNKVKFDYNQNITSCLQCHNKIQEERLNLLEKIITYNFLNIAPENKELYFNLLQFNGNPEEFVQALKNTVK